MYCIGCLPPKAKRLFATIYLTPFTLYYLSPTPFPSDNHHTAVFEILFALFVHLLFPVLYPHMRDITYIGIDFFHLTYFAFY